MKKLVALVVEDEVLIQLLLEEALQDSGFATETVSSGEAALEILHSDMEVSALVTDVNLKTEINGWDVARRARELLPNIPVIYVTSVAADEWTSQGVPLSVLIQKPFVPAQIITAISQLLNVGGQAQS